MLGLGKNKQEKFLSELNAINVEENDKWKATAEAVISEMLSFYGGLVTTYHPNETGNELLIKLYSKDLNFARSILIRKNYSELLAEMQIRKGELPRYTYVFVFATIEKVYALCKKLNRDIKNADEDGLRNLRENLGKTFLEVNTIFKEAFGNYEAGKNNSLAPKLRALLDAVYKKHLF